MISQPAHQYYSHHQKRRGHRPPNEWLRDIHCKNPLERCRRQLSMDRAYYFDALPPSALFFFFPERSVFSLAPATVLEPPGSTAFESAGRIFEPDCNLYWPSTTTNSPGARPLS